MRDLRIRGEEVQARAFSFVEFKQREAQLPSVNSIRHTPVNISVTPETDPESRICFQNPSLVERSEAGEGDFALAKSGGG